MYLNNASACLSIVNPLPIKSGCGYKTLSRQHLYAIPFQIMHIAEPLDINE